VDGILLTESEYHGMMGNTKTYDSAQSVAYYFAEFNKGIETCDKGGFSRWLFKGLRGIRMFPVFVVTFYREIKIEALRITEKSAQGQSMKY
jgi:hypothetical protein